MNYLGIGCSALVILAVLLIIYAVLRTAYERGWREGMNDLFDFLWDAVKAIAITAALCVLVAALAFVLGAALSTLWDLIH